MRSYPYRTRAQRLGFGVAMLCLSALSWATSVDPVANSAKPIASLSPLQVVQLQIEALRRNDDKDSGIEVAFRFASPNNKRMTGPLPRFASMIKNGPYALMLRFRDADFGEGRVVERKAAQPVTLILPGEPPVTFVFFLSRQSEEGPLRDCWMTDSVQIVPTPGTQA